MLSGEHKRPPGMFYPNQDSSCRSLLPPLSAVRVCRVFKAWKIVLTHDQHGGQNKIYAFILISRSFGHLSSPPRRSHSSIAAARTQLNCTIVAGLPKRSQNDSMSNGRGLRNDPLHIRTGAVVLSP